MLSKDDHARIAAAITEAESRTRGEIFCVLAHEVSRYREVPLGWGALAALLVPPLLVALGLHEPMWAGLFTSWTDESAGAAEGLVARALTTYSLVQAALFACVVLIVSLPAVRRAMTPRFLKRHRVRQRIQADIACGVLETGSGLAAGARTFDEDGAESCQGSIDLGVDHARLQAVDDRHVPRPAVPLQALTDPRGPLATIAPDLSGGAALPLDRLGVSVDIGTGFMLRAGLLMVPLVMMFAALQTIVAAYAKSYREAQTYLSLLMIIPMIPSVLMMVNPMKGETWSVAMPLLSQNLLVMEMAKGETVDLARFGLSFGASLAVAVLLVWVAVRIYHREQLAVSA